MTSFSNAKYVVSRLKAAYPRISPMSPLRDGFSACWCLHAAFDIDNYDRRFVPDGLQFRVRILDANFNEISTFGLRQRPPQGRQGQPAGAGDSLGVSHSGPCFR